MKVLNAGSGWGRTTATVTADLEEAAAFVWDFESRAHIATTGDIERVVGERRGPTEMVVKRRQSVDSTKFGGIHRERTFRNVMKICKVDSDTIMITMEPPEESERRARTARKTLAERLGSLGFGSSAPTPIQHVRKIIAVTKKVKFWPRAIESDQFSNNHPITKNGFRLLVPSLLAQVITDHVSSRASATVMAKESVVMKFKRKGEKKTDVEIITKLELGDFVSPYATQVSIQRHLDEIGEIERYFTNLVPLEEMTPELGDALGSDLVWDEGHMGGQHYRKQGHIHVEEMARESNALREVIGRYPWILTLLKRTRSGRLAINRPVSVKLACITEKEATVIGNNLIPCLKSRKTAKAGVEQWKEQNSAVGELFTELRQGKYLSDELCVLTFKTPLAHFPNPFCDSLCSLQFPWLYNMFV